jgi:hypothetical protein
MSTTNLTRTILGPYPAFPRQRPATNHLSLGLNCVTAL